MTKILFLSAPDSSTKAQKLIAILKSKGLRVSNLADLLKLENSKTSTSTVLAEAVENHDQVIVFISDGLFANCILKDVILLAIKKQKCISVAAKDDQTIMPGWFTKGFSGFRYFL